METDYAEKYKAINGNKILASMKLLGVDLPKVKFKDGTEASLELFKFILVSYGQIFKKLKPEIVPEADEAAALLSYDSLCEAMEQVSGNMNCAAYPCFIPLLCRFGSAKQIKYMISEFKRWGEWSQFGAKGRKAQDIFKICIVLSDTHEAVVFCEKQGMLPAYANLRGVSVDDIYENNLFDFGFDENGIRVFDLDVTKIEVSLTDELTLFLFNTATGKEVKSIPKKNVDPEVYAKASDDFADMRQNLKKAVKIKNDKLFSDFIEGTEFEAKNWKNSYFKNPLINKIGSILVWAQGENTFILVGNKTVFADGTEYSLTGEKIKLAHPMEMSTEDVGAWQKYFTSHNLKQPFSQVWEPVYDEKDIKPDRYKNCKIRALYLKNQQKRGISCEWYEGEWYESHEFYINGFSADARGTDEPDRLEIAELVPEKWNRRANMVIAYLDRITVYDRIKKDDASVMNQMERFTLAQITEFIKIAQENNATNVTALLLNYKNENFGDFDPMAEFTLD